MRTAAAIAAAEGDLESASATFGTFAQALAHAGLNTELIWTHIDLGRCLAKLDRSRAVAAFSAAADLAEAFSALSQMRLASQALRQLGVRAWRRGRAAVGDGVAALTEREREVATLIAVGNSNREIADHLVLSPKTVERHLTNILAKLDLRNRTELASRVLSSSVRGSPDD
jgi:DNA-binding NarL/FixJ family response regulator